jgi:hypothetical protein
VFLHLLAPPAVTRAEAPGSAVSDAIRKSQRGWILDANGGAPVLKSGESRFVASGMIGYRWEKIEVILSGRVNQFSSTSDHVFNNTASAGWRLNGAYLTGAVGDPLRLLFVADLSQAAYITRYRELPDLPRLDLTDRKLAFDLNIKNEDSNLIRNSGLLGVLWTPSPRTQVRAGIGLGFQVEIYVMTLFRRDDSGTEAAFDADLHLSIRQLGLFALRHQLASDIIAVRLTSEASRFDLSRSSAAVKVDLRNPSLQSEIRLFTFTQIESSNRLAVDIEKLGFLGLMPSVFAGLDLGLLRGDVGSATAVVPVFGIGLTNGRF